MALSFTVLNKFKAVDKISAPIKKMTKNVINFGVKSRQGFKRAEDGAGGLTKKMKGLAVGLGILLSIQSVTNALADAVAVGAEFEQTIVNASAKFGPEAAKGTANFNKLEEAARKAGATTEFSASAAGEGLDFLAMAGFNAEQSIAALPGVIDLATVANVELGRASDIATDTLGAMGLATKDATQLQVNLARVTDVMAKTSTSANLSMEQMFASLVKGGPQVTAAGQSIETASALLGIMANNGIKAEIAGTSLANAYLNLSKPSSTAQKALSNLGIQLQDNEGKLLDMPDIIDNFNKATSKLTKVQRQATIETVFGREGLAGMVAVLNAGGDELRAYRTDLENATGANKAMATAMRDTRLNQFKSISSAIEGVKISTFKAIDSQLGRIGNTVLKLVRATDNWIQSNEFLINNVLEALLGTLSGIWNIFKIGVKIFKDGNDFLGGKFVQTILAVVAAFKAWSVIMGIVNLIMTANPLGLLVVAIVAVGAAIKAIIDNWESLVAAFKNIKIPVPKSLQNLLDKLDALKNKVGGFFGGGDDSGSLPPEPQLMRGGVPLSPQTQTNRIINERLERSTVDVNFNNTPQGTTFAGKGGKGVNMNVGFSGAL